jgi:hypothetical protein
VTAKKIIDQLLESLKPGDLVANDRLKIVRGPFKSVDDVNNDTHEMCWSSGNAWYAVVATAHPTKREHRER